MMNSKKRKGSIVYLEEPGKTFRMTPSKTDVIPPDVPSSYFSLDEESSEQTTPNEQVDQNSRKIMRKMIMIDEASVGKLLSQNSNLVDSLNQLKKVVNGLTEDIFKYKEQLTKQDKKIAQLKRQMDEEHPPQFPASAVSKWDRSPSYIN